MVEDIDLLILHIDYLDDKHGSKPVSLYRCLFPCYLLSLDRCLLVLSIAIESFKLSSILLIQPEVERSAARATATTPAGSGLSRNHMIWLVEVLFYQVRAIRLE